MPTPSPDTPPATDRSLTVIAAAVAIALVAMAAWFITQGGPWGGLVHHDAAPAATERFTVNVNTAPVDELAQLPGIGPATARRIVDHRHDHGPFASIDALLDVPDIGPATLEAIRPHLRPITVSGTSP
jgi:competence ComEA-like helix-hairpin-helix protein